MGVLSEDFKYILKISSPAEEVNEINLINENERWFSFGQTVISMAIYQFFQNIVSFIM